jgi:hypothetical protein
MLILLALKTRTIEIRKPAPFSGCGIYWSDAKNPTLVVPTIEEARELAKVLAYWVLPQAQIVEREVER